MACRKKDAVIEPAEGAWRMPSGYPEEHANRLGQLQIAMIALEVAIRSHHQEVARKPEYTPAAMERYMLAVSLSANHLLAKSADLEQAKLEYFETSRLVGRALMRCETADGASPTVIDHDEKRH